MRNQRGGWRVALATIAIAIAIAIASLPSGAALGDQVAQKQAKPQPTLEELIERLEQQNRVLENQQKRLAEQEKRLQEYKEALERALAEQRLRLQDLEAHRGTGTQVVGAPPASTETATDPAPKREEAKKKSAGPTVVAQTKPEPGAQTPQKPAGQAPESSERPPEIAQITEYPGVLTPAKKIVLEPALQYSYASGSRVTLAGFTILPAIVIGEVNIENLNRQLLVGSLTARYGLTSRVEVEMKVPYVYRSETTTGRPLLTQSSTDQTLSASGSGLGDIEFTARAQLNKGGPDTPYFVGSLRFKTTTGTGPFDVPVTEVGTTGIFVQSELPTGTGFYALQPGITALYASDPAVLFGGASYIWNIARNNVTTAGGVSIGSYDPGDGFTINFGLGLSLNERTSFSVGYEQDVFFKDKQNGQYIVNAQNQTLGTLLIGYSYRLSRSTTVNLSLGVGVTSEAPDITIWLRLPVML